MFTLSVSPAYCVYPSSPLDMCSMCTVSYCFHALFFLHGIRARGLRTSTADFSFKGKTYREEQGQKLDRGMASSLPTEKLNRNNYASWSYKMHQYLLGHGYWSYVDGANDTTPDSTHRDFPAWE